MVFIDELLQVIKMASPENITLSAPSLPKGGGAIQSIGKGWGAVGTSGAASQSIAFPLSVVRGVAPGLSLDYQSTGGNGLFGVGWSMARASIRRRTAQGVPAYGVSDEMLGPSGDVIMAERTAAGAVISQTLAIFRGVAVPKALVTRYRPRVEGSFDWIEHWSPAGDQSNGQSSGFWVIQGADGTAQVFGKRAVARVVAPQEIEDLGEPPRIAEWLLEETVTPNGEHIFYDYSADPGCASNLALSRVRYANLVGSRLPYLFGDTIPDTWLCELIVDYGQRSTALTAVPSYQLPQPEPVAPARLDIIHDCAFGFELTTRRLCHQVLMFHHFAELGDAPVLVQRLLFEYDEDPLLTHLSAAHLIAYDAQGKPSYCPPMEFSYSGFALEEAAFSPFVIHGLNPDVPYQMVDLYGEGLSGVLWQSDKAWRYQEPMRAATGGDDVTYGASEVLPLIPAQNMGAGVRQSLMDMTGDGKLDWVVAQPGMCGFFTLAPDRTWSGFAPFGAFPAEFFHPSAQLADLIGNGLSEVALIGPRSVSLYPNRRTEGFGAGQDVSHAADDLPQLNTGHNELVAFSDVLGSGQQHLVRIRHNEVKVWPNLGRGKFGAGRLLFNPGFERETFDPARVLLADLDGSGAPDLIYLESKHAKIFLNQSGNGFAAAHVLDWPEGFTYDRLCQVSVADLLGLGCASLVISRPYPQPQQWRCDFVKQAKPYLLNQTNNNMGMQGGVQYRSSAQEWLDEKNERVAAGEKPVSYLPFALHVVTGQTQTDEITGATLQQRFSYRQGFYDGVEREFRGFGLLVQTDAETIPELPVQGAGGLPDEQTAPVRVKTWFHTGSDVEHRGFYLGDTKAVALGDTLYSRWSLSSEKDEVANDFDLATQQDLTRALSGSVLRSETFAMVGDVQAAIPFAVSETRHLVRLQEPKPPGQRYSITVPLVLETLTRGYEQFDNDPMCQHGLMLAFDAFAMPTHSIGVSYARRDVACPYTEEHKARWWNDAHDEAQNAYYFSETLLQPIHLTDRSTGVQLGLPYLSRANAFVIAGAELSPTGISYECFIDPQDPVGQQKVERTLTGLTLQKYQGSEVGAATFGALADYTQTAELDAHALTAYTGVVAPEALDGLLIEAGYQLMSEQLPPGSAQLWAVKSNFATYAPIEDFYQVIALQPTLSHGITKVEYDDYGCQIVSVTQPDGCTTKARYDYRTFQPVHITDPNNNIQEALYDGLGRLRASSFHGTERGEPVGFDPIGTYKTECELPEQALENPQEALKNAATSCFYDAFSWMGQPTYAQLKPLDASFDELVIRRVLMPTGHLRASARAAFAEPVARIPNHAAVLQADRYPGDPERQIRIAIAFSDGFGRVLQSKQKVEAGEAYSVGENGELNLDANDQPVKVQADPRWRVSERVEYNNKGLPVRTYRPYFSNTHRVINDVSFRKFGYCDRHFYDALGREIHALTAKGYERRMTYLGWYTIAEDENDMEAEKQMQEKPPAVTLH